INREMGPFVLAMKNARDLARSGKEVVLVFEDKATALLFELKDPSRLSTMLFNDLIKARMVIICRTCAMKTNAFFTLDQQKLDKIQVVGEPEMDGHVPMREYIDRGFQIIVV
ncbi:MAG TPA: hypothetical protein PKH10_02900, partial [bacterium]|nr:hypothetical protein [bacterium]